MAKKALHARSVSFLTLDNGAKEDEFFLGKDGIQMWFQEDSEY